MTPETRQALVEQLEDLHLDVDAALGKARTGGGPLRQHLALLDAHMRARLANLRRGGIDGGNPTETEGFTKS